MPTLTELRSVEATRYVTPFREGGSMPGLVEASDDGLYVTKFRGAGQGPQALIAEIIVGELARALGLPVPGLVTVEIDPALGVAEPDPEIQELLEASDGTNLGVDFLPSSLTFSPATDWEPDPEFAANVVWLDAFTTNVDRTAQNPNLLLWHEQVWLIDHGAALYLQHAGLDPDTQAQKPFPQIAQHVLLPCADSILAADERLAPLVTESLLGELAALVPSQWFTRQGPEIYVEYLAKRIASPRAFAKEAEDARTAA